MAKPKAVFHIKYTWRPDWIPGEDTIIASSSEEAREKAEKKLLGMTIDELAVEEVQVISAVKGTDVTL